MSAMLLSIKPEFVKNILRGTKEYEFRKCKPRNDVDHLFIYETAPRKKVVAEADVERIVEGSPDEVWNIAHNAAGISEGFYYSYYEGRDKAIALKLVNVEVFDTPRNLSDYGLRCAPQSYAYV